MIETTLSFMSEFRDGEVKINRPYGYMHKKNGIFKQNVLIILSLSQEEPYFHILGTRNVTLKVLFSVWGPSRKLGFPNTKNRCYYYFKSSKNIKKTITDAHNTIELMCVLHRQLREKSCLPMFFPLMFFFFFLRMKPRKIKEDDAPRTIACPHKVSEVLSFWLDSDL